MEHYYDSENTETSMITFSNKLTYPLKFDPFGPHTLGGSATHKGVLPPGSNVPVHKLLTIQVDDPKVPFTSGRLTSLPLYYPLKYGAGGASMQYSVLSDDEIDIFYMSDPEPDEEEWAYVKVREFPEMKLSAQEPIVSDEDLDWFTITLAGKETLDHHALECQNPKCPHRNSNSAMRLIASVPPAPIPGHDDIWWEFDGGYLLFYFWLCEGCDSIITTNWCT